MGGMYSVRGGGGYVLGGGGGEGGMYSVDGGFTSVFVLPAVSLYTLETSTGSSSLCPYKACGELLCPVMV